ncbi:MAG: phenylacetate-CoA oxygenase subunit PaaJ [Betaproteobacteria bacterium]|nr:phenylacetate-CoA oxygenase subunit PaaJ [Betaproteobacteria bacterium]
MDKASHDQTLLEAIEALPDPEIPVISLGDLGIVRGFHREAGRVVVSITPTYSGCPATEVIRADILALLEKAGEHEGRVQLRYAPAWTSDWISAQGRLKLKAYGIAPPAACLSGANEASRVFPLRPLNPIMQAQCPRCDATSVERLSEFGSTACKALYRCLACREPFDYFKPY